MWLFHPRAGPRRPRMELPQSTTKPDQEIRGEPSVAKVANYLPPRDEVACSPVARRVGEPALAPNLALALVLTWPRACEPALALVLAWPRACEPALALVSTSPRVYCRAAALACRFACLLLALARQSRRFRPRLSLAWNGRSGAPPPDCSVRRHLGLGGLAASRHWRASRQNRRRFGAELMCPSRLPWKAPLLP
jgi:hypothetical protein